MDAKTQQDMQIEIIILQKSRSLMTLSSNYYPWFSSEEKTYQWLLAKNERVQATVDQCAASQMKYSGPKGKCKKKYRLDY